MQVVTTHKNTDFDGLSSVVAAGLLFPQARLVLPRQINPNVRAFLSLHKDLFLFHGAEEIPLEQVRTLVAVDVCRWERIEGRLAKLRAGGNLQQIWIWDHHPGGDMAAAGGCQEESGAAITLLIRRLRSARKRLTPIQATLFLCGLYEDTGNLSFPATRPQDAAAAAYLLAHKADLHVLGNFLRPAYGERQKNVLFEMLKVAQRARLGGRSVSIGRVELEGHVDGLAVVVRMFREILNVEVAFGIFTQAGQERCIVIGRSASDAVDIGAMMRAMGGGGHPAAGSAQMRHVNPEVVEAMLCQLLAGNQQVSVQISDLMSFPVVSVDPDTPMSQVAAILRERGFTGLPVARGDRLVGVISRRDFKKIKKPQQLDAPVKAFMNASPLSIPPGKSPMQAARLMVKHDIGRLPVVEEGRIIGIITRSDAMRYFYDLLPD
jgi:nanoRNase/pAp phosphatase (c-di-AMP/oligoRNAs hydrolase)